jgi:ATP synthase protein I
MTQTTPTGRWHHDGPDADPWSALSSIIAGVLLWGAIGWGLSVWLHARALIGAGLVVGGVLGVASVYLRYGRNQSGPPVTAGPVLSARNTASTDEEETQ